MSALRWILTIILIIEAIALTIVVLMQEGRSQGLGAIAGAAETYWGKNKSFVCCSRFVSCCVIFCHLTPAEYQEALICYYRRRAYSATLQLFLQ